MTERDIQNAAKLVVNYAATCQMRNSLAWMEGFARLINTFNEAIGDDDRVTTFGTGLQIVTAEELSTLNQYGYPNQ